MAEWFWNDSKQRGKRLGTKCYLKFNAMAHYKGKAIMFNSVDIKIVRTKVKIPMGGFPFGISALWSNYFFNVWHGMIHHRRKVTDWFQQQADKQLLRGLYCLVRNSIFMFFVDRWMDLVLFWFPHFYIIMLLQSHTRKLLLLFRGEKNESV